MNNLQVCIAALAAASCFSLAACGGAPSLPVAEAAKPAPTPSPSPAPTPGSDPLHFSASGAQWLYQAPTGSGINISGATAGLSLSVNAHDGGFDYPVQTTDGSHGCTTFTDNKGPYGTHSSICIPNPTSGFWPSHGGWGSNDGHLVVVNTSTGDFYDFWKLVVDGNGRPTSTDVGRLAHGNLSTSNGTPGTTGGEITGLAGDIMPGELDCDTCLNHALNVVVPGGMNSSLIGHQAPATKTDGTVSGAIFREGAKLRLDPSFDVAGMQASTAAKAILRALQLYGGVITDQTGGPAISFYSSLSTAPDLRGIQKAAAHLWIYY